jgi:23S rRNA (uracil1939-C5)-methyltransferase
MSCSDRGETQDIAVSGRNGGDSAVELRVEALAAGGRGVARHAGVVWFVPDTVPGDLVVAAPRRRRRGFVEARLLRRLENSPDRRAAPCPLQATCGGCPWMVLDETVQREWRATLVRDALRRIGRDPVLVEDVRAGSPPLGYRNKVELTLGRTASGRRAIGFHASDAADGGLVDVDRCPLQGDAANAVLGTARELLLARTERWPGPPRPGADPPRLVLRSSATSGKVLVALREGGRAFPGAGPLGRALAAARPEVSGVVRIRARPGRRGGARIEPLAGRPWLRERFGGLDYRLPAATFVQVNAAAGEVLLDLVREAAGPVGGRSVIELYGGVGVFAAALARSGAEVTVCEADADAVRCGRRATRDAGIGGVRFLHSDVTAFLRARLKEGRTADVVVANPPRGGMGNRLPEQIANLGARRVVLVSCDPATLARDTRRLAAAGFEAERAIPVDVFPQTAHVETVLTMARG